MQYNSAYRHEKGTADGIVIVHLHRTHFFLMIIQACQIIAVKTGIAALILPVDLFHVHHFEESQ